MGLDGREPSDLGSLDCDLVRKPDFDGAVPGRVSLRRRRVFGEEGCDWGSSGRSLMAKGGNCSDGSSSPGEVLELEGGHAADTLAANLLTR